MENETDNLDSQEAFNPKPIPLEINTTSKGYLLEVAKWSKLFAVLGFALTGLIVLASLFMGSLVNLVGSLAQMGPTIEGTESPFDKMGSSLTIMVTFFYLLFAVLYFFPSFYLYKFSIKMKIGLLHDDQFNVEEGFKNLKSVFKFWGIITVLLLAFYMFSFIVGILSTVFL